MDPGRKQVQRRSADRFAIDVIDVSAALKAQTRQNDFAQNGFLSLFHPFSPLANKVAAIAAPALFPETHAFSTPGPSAKSPQAPK